MDSGVQSQHSSGALLKSLTFGDYMVQVKYVVIDGLIKISDAWVKKP